MFELPEGTRTLVLLCAFSTYDAPSKPKRKQLPTLDRIEPTLQRLQQLLTSDLYAAEGIQPLTLLNSSKRELLESLEAMRDELSERPGVNLVVFWSGHGNIHEKSFRLATRNTCDPIEYEDGIGLNDVLRESGVARVNTWTLFLDACYAGEGLGDVMGAAHDLLKSESGRLLGYGALCASAPFERSRDSVFLDTVIDVLEQGMSETARTYAEIEGGSGEFHPHTRLLSLGELFDAVSIEFRADPSKYRHAQPWSILDGPIYPRLFPNPQFREREPSRLVESAYRAIVRASDLESHFFPKAVGIDNLESGWHFAGRVDATRSILAWMSGPAESANDRLLVLAADGGTGKSALLGRLIALTDADYRAKAKAQGWNEAQDLQAGTVPQPDRIDAALSLRNLTAQTLAEHLAGLLGVALTDSIEGFVRSAVQSFRRADGAPPCTVLDALDEAQEPAAIVFRVVRPLADAGWKVLVATRRTAQAKGANNLVADLGPATLLELDKDAQSWGDIHAYALGRFSQAVALAAVTDAAARLIADRADGKFLFARMATSSLLRTTGHVAPEALPALVARDATEALQRDVVLLDEEFERHFACKGDGATAMLTALAWSEGDGIPLRDGVWAAMADAVGSLKAPGLKFEERHLLWLLREAGRFIQESGDGEQAVYRLFHKSLVDYFQGSPLHATLRNAPVLEALDERIALALVARVRASHDWAYTNPYLISHMPAHLALRAEQKGLNNLLLNFDWIQARLNLNGIQALLSDFQLCVSAYPSTARLHRTLSMVAHILRENPDQLVSQLLGRIAPGVPDIAPLLNGQPGANFGLPPPSQDGLNITQRLMLQLPDVNIEHNGVDLINRTLSLDGLLERAKASLHGPRWLPELGGLTQAGALVFILQGHDNTVTSVALSADGRTVVSGSYDNTVRLWDAQTGKAARTLQGHENTVTSAALSADGRTVFSGSRDNTVRLWDAQTGQPLQTLLGHEDGVTSVTLSADGRTIVSGSRDNTVRLWDAQTGQALRTLQGHQDWVTSVTLSADGRSVVSGSRDHTVRLWDAHTGQVLRTLQGHENTVTSVALSADGRTVVSGSDDHTVRLWEAHTGQALRTLLGHEDGVTSVAVNAVGLTVVSGGRDNTVRLWDAQTGQALRTLQGHQDWVTSVTLSADGRTIVSGSRDHTVRLWDVQTEQALQTQQGHENTVTSVAMSADGSTVVSGSRDNTVRLWDAQTGRALRTLLGHEDWVTSVTLSADGRTVVSGGDDDAVRLWDTQTGQALRTLLGHEDGVTSVTLSADGRTVVSGSRDNTVRLWDSQTGLALRTLQGHQDWVTSVTLSADGRSVVSGSDDNTVRLRDAHTGQALRTMQGHENTVTSVALSADGRTVVSGSDDRTVRLWDAQTGQALRTLLGHEDGVTSVTLTADGRTVVSGSDDNTLRLWDAQTGRLLERLDMDEKVLSVALAEHLDRTAMVVACGRVVVRLTRCASKPQRA